MVYSQIRTLKNDYYLEWLRRLHRLHRSRPRTLSIRFFGIRQICTIEGENLKAIQATNLKDFGLKPMHRKTKGGMPFADKGISTTDGKNWEFARYLVKPFFTMRSMRVSTVSGRTWTSLRHCCRGRMVLSLTRSC
jgi:cytochrome P450 monooxygenase